MSEKPGKRLVSKEEYTRLMTRRVCLLLFAFGFVFFGFAIVLPQVTSLILHSEPDVVAIFTTAFTVCFAGPMFFMAFYLFRKEKKFERVAMMPNHVNSDISAEESLLRASDLPPSHQQAELLRASKPGQETPPQELLRATTNRQGD